MFQIKFYVRNVRGAGHAWAVLSTSGYGDVSGATSYFCMFPVPGPVIVQTT